MQRIALAAALLAASLAAQAEPATYNIDPTHTFVTYEIGHFGTSTNRGRFQAKEGSVQFDKAAKSGKVEVSFDVAAVSTGVAPLDKHLKSPDFFNADKFPTVSFSADKFGFSGDKVSEVRGTLTMLGKTHPVTLKARNFNCYQNPMFKREVCGGDFETTIQRSQWGVNWGLDMGFPDAVHLLVQVEAVKQ
ncbi:MAG: YceI family protein [Pseudomonadota bacterium]